MTPDEQAAALDEIDRLRGALDRIGRLHGPESVHGGIECISVEADGGCGDPLQPCETARIISEVNDNE